MPREAQWAARHRTSRDAVQQALLIAWRRLPTLRDNDRFEAWLFKLLVNACYAEVRSTRRGGVSRYVHCVLNDAEPKVDGVRGPVAFEGDSITIRNGRRPASYERTV